MRLIFGVAATAFAVMIAIPASASSFAVKSRSYVDGAMMPLKLVYRGYGCTGGNLSPDLAWTGVPKGTASFAITLHDPDAPHAGGWWHWVAFNIPASARGLRLGAGDAAKKLAPASVMEGTTDFGSPGYGGPCPPPGSPPHHYVLTVYALNVRNIAGASARTTGPQLRKLMDGHVLGTVTLVGRFGR